MFKINDTIWAKILYRLPFTNVDPHWKYIHSFDRVDFIYLRKPYMSFAFIRFLKQIKRNSKAKVIIEFPTYPYDGELRERIIDYPIYFKEKIARRFLRGNVDRIATLTDDEFIFGVQTIKILNGYDFSKISIIPIERTDDEIRICCIARFMPWHGYERLLNGLADYYASGGKRNIIVSMVGDGAEIDKYKKIVEEKELNLHVNFYGYQSIDQIERILNESDIGAGSFGLYKVDFYGVGAYLKTREYLAVGLPVIAGTELDFMQYPELCPFALVFSNDSTDVNIEKILNFYDGLKGPDQMSIRYKIRETAEKYLNMDNAMEKVINYIKES